MPYIDKDLKVRNCCCVLSLNTGFTLILIIDVLTLAALMVDTFRQYQNQDEKTADLLFYFLVTDGIMLIMFLAKVFYGFNYIRLTICKPKVTPEIAIAENVDERYRVFCLKAQKR